MGSVRTSTRDSGLLQAGLAAAVHAAGYVALAYDREPIVTCFYQWAWWSYIVAADGLVYAKRGDSLLRSRPREFLLIGLLSILFWFHFETWNLRLQDWYYVNAYPGLIGRTLLYCTAFATVLPGVFESYDLLDAYGLPRRIRVRPITLGPHVWNVSYALGIAMGLLPLLWPTYAFPLVWGTFVFLLDPINARWGGHSFWVDWSRGDLTRFGRTLLAGLICGGLWESWNFWARAKWLYTVPLFDELKLFEMPLLGFLGFPPFAVELMCMTTFVTLLRNVPGWSAVPEAATRGPILSSRAWRRLAAAAVLYVAAQLILTDRYTIGSYYVRLRDSVWGQTDAGHALVAAGYAYPEDVALALNTPAGRLRVAKALAWPRDDLETVTGPILLSALQPVGSRYAFYLVAVHNIYTLDRLAQADAQMLAKPLPRQPVPGGGSVAAPPVRRAEMWVQAARREIRRWPAWRRELLGAASKSAIMRDTHANE